ncbi:hypothetical protein [Chroococcidiopsis sp [FACHB-1243]]|nr:hypothetical protein [Chroococcidiopsis sp. [FACHB-1243]]
MREKGAGGQGGQGGQGRKKFTISTLYTPHPTPYTSHTQTPIAGN